jgi:spore coat polysaccharide biosynthesis protein SpsF
MHSSEKRIGILIQARTSSNRLPRKVLLPLPYAGDKTVLQHVLERCQRSKLANHVAVVTSTDPSDDELEAHAQVLGFPVFRGSLDDVLDRYAEAAKEWALDVVVRITSDCPLTDPAIIDKCIAHLLAHSELDYVATNRYPLGLSAEVMHASALSKAQEEATEKPDREHVTLYIKRDSQFRCEFLNPPAELDHYDCRVTLDTAEDYALLCALYKEVYVAKPDFTAEDMIGFMQAEPWLKMINQRIMQKQQPRDLIEELEESIRVLRSQDLPNTAKMLEAELTLLTNQDSLG